MKKISIYLAGPLFTAAEREWNVSLARRLEFTGIKVWLPQEHEPRALTPQSIFNEDVRGIDQAQAVVAIMDGSDPDSGTCWECGYANAKGKPTYLVRTDFRGGGENIAGSSVPFNLMLTESAKKVMTFKMDTPLSKIADTIAAALREK